MKYRLLTVVLIALMLFSPIMSAAAFWHPEDEVPECADGIAVFGVLIEGEGTTSTERFNFTEPEYGYCTEFTVEVWILSVEDLYGYEFKLSWNEDYFTLVGYVVEETWENQFKIRPEDTYDMSSPYHQAVVAVAPSPGVTGEFKLATLTFHIYNDACWAWDEDLLGRFYIYDYLAKDSCTAQIRLCCPLHGYWRFIPTQPKIYLDPALEENCVIYDEFTMTIWVEDILKMKSIHFRLHWFGHSVLYLGNRELIHLEKYVINEDVLPEAEMATGYPDIDLDQGPVESWLNVSIVMDDDFPLINGTFWLMELTFEKQDPWYCGGQPGYIIDEDTHEITTVNATTDILFYYGWFDVECPDLEYIEFGDVFGDMTGERDYAIYGNAEYIFDTVPGDLTGDGVVDLDDLMIIASLYCFPTGFPDPYSPHSAFPAQPHGFWLYYYDFSGDDHIGLEEIIVVSKNFGRVCEEHTKPGDP
jgi:hypothetical protein